MKALVDIPRNWSLLALGAAEELLIGFAFIVTLTGVCCEKLTDSTLVICLPLVSLNNFAKTSKFSFSTIAFTLDGASDIFLSCALPLTGFICSGIRRYFNIFPALLALAAIDPEFKLLAVVNFSNVFAVDTIGLSDPTPRLRRSSVMLLIALSFVPVESSSESFPSSLVIC